MGSVDQRVRELREVLHNLERRKRKHKQKSNVLDYRCCRNCTHFTRIRDVDLSEIDFVVLGFCGLGRTEGDYNFYIGDSSPMECPAFLISFKNKEMTDREERLSDCLYGFMEEEIVEAKKQSKKNHYDTLISEGPNDIERRAYCKFCKKHRAELKQLRDSMEKEFDEFKYKKLLDHVNKFIKEFKRKEGAESD